MKAKYIIILLLALAVIVPHLQAHAATITVTTDHQPVANESFQLIFETRDNVDDDPDFAPLEKNLTILNRGVRSNTRIINGDISHSKQWTLSVITDKAGPLTIPAIHFGSDTSQPLMLNVAATAPQPKSTPNSSHAGKDIFIDTDLSTLTPYVQAQVIYTVRLYMGVNTSNATLSEPKVADGQAVIQKLGDDTNYQTRVNGKPYNVVERRYAIFPQQSGKISIPPVTFQGQTGTGMFIDPFGPPPQTLVAHSDPVELDVKPIPAAFSGKDWLPASNLTIQEQWSHDPGSLPQGEAVTRTLIIKANGLPASQLAVPDNKLPNQFKQYPDQPKLSESNDKDGLIGTREEKMAIVALGKGKYNLPEISIPWWNTKTDKQETAELPERTITVVPGTAPLTNPAPQQPVVTPPVSQQTQPASKPHAPDVTTTPVSHDVTWKWISVAFAILWLLTLIMWWWRGRNQNTVIPTQTVPEKYVPDQKRVIQDLKQACAQNDPLRTKQLLLEWGLSIRPADPPASLGILAQLCPAGLARQIMQLNQMLYGKNSAAWHGELLWNEFLTNITGQKKPEKKITPELEPLYKLDH